MGMAAAQPAIPEQHTAPILGQRQAPPIHEDGASPIPTIHGPGKPIRIVYSRGAPLRSPSGR